MEICLKILYGGRHPPFFYPLLGVLDILTFNIRHHNKSLIISIFVCNCVHRWQRYGLSNFYVSTHDFVFFYHEQVGFRSGCRGFYAPPEQLLIEMFAKSTTHQIQGNRVDTRVYETQTKSNDS